MKNVVFIGAGNLAFNLAKALYNTDYHICQIFSRTELAAYGLAQRIGAAYTTDLSLVRNDADIYIVSVKDSVLTERITEICAGKGNALLFHTAGSIPMDVFKGKALHYGVLYPMQTFSKSKEVDFKKITCYVEGASAEDLTAIKQLASSISDNVQECDSEQRKYLHLAAVFVCNFSNHLYDIADHFLSEHGLEFKSMLPLIDETVNKIHSIKPEKAQTGPAIRYDRNVIEMQSHLLTDHPTWQSIYNIMSRSIHESNKTIKQ